MIYSAWNLKQLFKACWQKVDGFKAIFWRATGLSLLVYIAVGVTAIFWLLAAKNSIVLLVIGISWYLLGILFCYLPVQVGVIRLSIKWLQQQPIEVSSIFRFLNASLLVKIGFVSFMGFFFLIIASAIPTWWGQVIGFILSLWIFSAVMLAWLYLAQNNETIDHTAAFMAFGLRHHWWQLALLMLICNVVFLLGMLTLGIAFIWLAPWLNHIWASVYLLIKDEYHAHMAAHTTS